MHQPKCSMETFRCYVQEVDLKAQAAISRDDFVGKFILTASRRLSPEEEVSVPTLAEWYIIPPEIKRICEHAKLTTDTTQPMRNFSFTGTGGYRKDRRSQSHCFRTSPSLPLRYHFWPQRYSTFYWSDSSGCGRKTHPASAAVPVFSGNPVRSLRCLSRS